MTFEKVKKMYNDMREEERKKLSNALEQQGFKVVKGGNAGKGKSNYTAGNTLKLAYDLTNWKYVECYKDNYLYFLSLQAFDYDPNSHNHHVLMDRIGVYKYDGLGIKDRKKSYNPKDAFEKMVTTDIELPLDNEKISKLIEMMCNI